MSDRITIQIRHNDRVIFDSGEDGVFVSAGDRDKADAIEACLNTISEIGGYARARVAEPQPPRFSQGSPIKADSRFSKALEAQQRRRDMKAIDGGKKP